MKLSFVSKLWLNLAILFDPIQYFFNKKFWNIFRHKFGKYTNLTILDLACGTGEISDFISPKKYLGVDINKAYIHYAISKRASSNTHFQVGDITKIRLNKKYEIAFLISAAHHLSDDQIHTLCRNLKKNKIPLLLLVDGYPIGIFNRILEILDSFLAGGDYFRNQNEITKLLKQHGKILKKGTFTVVDSYYIYPYALLKIS